jgi:hypothetical protein
MRAPDSSIDYAQLLSKHYDPTLAEHRIKEVHSLLSQSSKPLGIAERSKRGWDEAYDLRPWHEFPDTDRISIPGVILQNLTGGIFGTGGGPTKETIDYGQQIRQFIVSDASVST